MRGERMSLYAQVIVDVPTMQTNKPYTYLVPSELEEQIQAGMRCVVPFGKGSRKIQGFVLDVSNQKPDEDFEIKKIVNTNIATATPSGIFLFTRKVYIGRNTNDIIIAMNKGISID